MPARGGARRAAGQQGLRPRDMLTRASFENAIVVHAAISGSTNSLLHIPAIAHELGIDIDGQTFDSLHRHMPFLLNLRPAGKWPAEFFYYAGGVPAIMEEIRDQLHLDAMTVTGKTLGENLDELKGNGYYDRCQSWLQAANRKYGLHLTREDIICRRAHPLGHDGSNCGAVWKSCAGGRGHQAYGMPQRDVPRGAPRAYL